MDCIAGVISFILNYTTCTHISPVASADLDRIRQHPSGTGTVRLRAALLHNLPFRRGTPYQLTLHLPPLEEPSSGISHIKQTGASSVAPLYAPAGDEGLDLSDGDADGISAAPVVELSASYLTHYNLALSHVILPPNVSLYNDCSKLL